MARLAITVRAALDTAALLRLYDRLALFPRSGMRRESLGRNIRIGVVEPYIVIYQYRQPDTVLIVRVLDGRRNITRRLVRE